MCGFRKAGAGDVLGLRKICPMIDFRLERQIVRAIRKRARKVLPQAAQLARKRIRRIGRLFRNGEIRVAALTMVYNEALILPYFLRHYSYVDEIRVLFETDTSDSSLEILHCAPNVLVEKCHIDGGLDDVAKINLFNDALSSIKADWVYVVDPDEFIFPPNESPCDFLRRQDADVVQSAMYQVYRHRNDRDLDPNLPPVPQRAHGDPNPFSNEESARRPSNTFYIKPNIVRPWIGARFLPGHHVLEGRAPLSSEAYVGAHWQMADPAIALQRRMERKARLSERNRSLRMGWQNFDVEEEEIQAECDRHLDDPVIETLASFREPPVFGPSKLPVGK